MGLSKQDRAVVSAALLNAPDRIAAALQLATRYGGIDGAYHKMWVIDQMVRALAGTDYETWVRVTKAGADGPNTYDWNTGVAP